MGIVIVIIGIVVLGFRISHENTLKAEREAEEAAAKQAILEDKRSGKTCVDIVELKDFLGMKNICVEYVVGDIGSNSTFIYLNRTKNTDFAATIVKSDNLIQLSDAKARYLNKKIRVRGTIKYYDSEKYKYYEIMINDLSQIELI